MPKTPTRILLLEDNLADLGFLREALNELEELHQGHAWLSPFEIIDAETLEEAKALLEEVPIDVILANLWLPDSRGMTTLRHLRRAAPDAPLIVLLGAEDPSLTVSLIQAGAQDVLVKHEVDCTPLGRAIRCAIERNRVHNGLRQLSTRDPLSGLLNSSAFHHFGQSLLAVLSLIPPDSCASSIGLLDLSNLPALAEISGPGEEDWLIVEAAAILSAAALDGELLAYSSRGRFHLLAPGRAAKHLHLALQRCASHAQAKAAARGLGIELQTRTAAIDITPHCGFHLDSLLHELDNALWDNSPLVHLCEAEPQTMIQ